MDQKKNNVELDKDTRILKHMRREEGKKSHHSTDFGKSHYMAKPEKRAHDYMYLQHLDKFSEEEAIENDAIEEK